MPWIIKELTDKGKGELYRYHVAGENTEHPVPQTFSWAVPNLKDDRYVAHPQATPYLKAMLEAAKAG